MFLSLRKLLSSKLMGFIPFLLHSLPSSALYPHFFFLSLKLNPSWVTWKEQMSFRWGAPLKKPHRAKIRVFSGIAAFCFVLDKDFSSTISPLHVCCENLAKSHSPDSVVPPGASGGFLFPSKSRFVAILKTESKSIIALLGRKNMKQVFYCPLF